MLQIIINIFISTSLYLLVSISVLVIYYTVRFFNIANATLITLGAYLLFFFKIQTNTNLFIGVIMSVFLVSIIGILFEVFIFKRLRNKNVNSLILLISSLGIYIIFQNIIPLLWGNNNQSLYPTIITKGNEYLNLYITNIQIIIISISISIFIAFNIFLKYSKIGILIRAISSNRVLANIFGVNSNRIIILTFVISSALSAIAGILVAFDTGMTPTMGFNLLLYGIVAMIIGGVGSTWGLIGGSLLLASAQHLGAYYIDSKWMDVIAYIILILFLIWKPLGFSGKRLKKIEI